MDAEAVEVSLYTRNFLCSGSWPTPTEQEKLFALALEEQIFFSFSVGVGQLNS